MVIDGRVMKERCYRASGDSHYEASEPRSFLLDSLRQRRIHRIHAWSHDDVE